MNPYSNILIGTDSMHSKSKKQDIIKNNSIVGKNHINKKDSEDARRQVSK
jgi:hypothetical protein